MIILSLILPALGTRHSALGTHCEFLCMAVLWFSFELWVSLSFSKYSARIANSSSFPLPRRLSEPRWSRCRSFLSVEPSKGTTTRQPRERTRRKRTASMDSRLVCLLGRRRSFWMIFPPKISGRYSDSARWKPAVNCDGNIKWVFSSLFHPNLVDLFLFVRNWLIKEYDWKEFIRSACLIWSFDRSIDWLIDRLIDWLVGWLIDR